MNKNLQKLTAGALMCALSVVLVWLVHFPIIPAAAYLEYDPGDIVIFFSTAVFGLPWGIAITLVTSLVQGITVSAQSGIYGILMHIIATGCYVAVYGLGIKLFSKTGMKKQVCMVVSAVCAVIAATAVMIPANMIVTPAFTGMAPEVIKGLLLPAIIPFNLIKLSVNSALSVTLYSTLKKPLGRIFQ